MKANWSEYQRNNIFIDKLNFSHSLKTSCNTILKGLILNITLNFTVTLSNPVTQFANCKLRYGIEGVSWNIFLKCAKRWDRGEVSNLLFHSYSHHSLFPRSRQKWDLVIVSCTCATSGNTDFTITIFCRSTNWHEQILQLVCHNIDRNITYITNALLLK